MRNAWFCSFIFSMPYTEASLREIMRFETLVPSGLPHKALVDTDFMGYNIPKVRNYSLLSTQKNWINKNCNCFLIFQGTVIMTALGAASHDNAIWDTPHEFKPERFLDDNGILSLKKDHSLPFGAGKRLCAGETFARNMLFLFTSAFFQAFSVSLPIGENVHKFEDNLTGLIRHTPDHWIQLHTR